MDMESPEQHHEGISSHVTPQPESTPAKTPSALHTQAQKSEPKKIEERKSELKPSPAPPQR